jgi:hypothetical protein
MAQTKIRGTGTGGVSQVAALTITDADVATAAAIATSKLADSANFILRGGSVAFTANQPMGGFKLTGLGAPTASGDAATKGYVDALAQGLDIHASVRAATTAALNTVDAAGAGIGKTLTKNTNGSINSEAVDGITLIVGDRLLVKNQAATGDNGIYTVTTVGSGSVKFVLTRATDFDEDAEVTAGAFAFLEEGSTLADTGWVLTTDNPITVDTTGLVFAQFSGTGSIVGGAGLTKTGNTIDVIAGDATIVVNADELHFQVTASGKIIVGSAGGIATPVTMSGDATIVASGAITIPFKSAWAVIRETPSGTVNGSNVTFTLANAPVSGTEQVYLNGLLQDAGSNDYSISTVTITFVTAPLSGDKILVSYYK